MAGLHLHVTLGDTAVDFAPPAVLRAWGPETENALSENESSAPPPRRSGPHRRAACGVR